jgi:deoxyribodipyrimidine photolyase
MKPEIVVVWFKRDLRTVDHLPLKTALLSGKRILPLASIRAIVALTGRLFPKT